MKKFLVFLLCVLSFLFILPTTNYQLLTTYAQSDELTKQLEEKQAEIQKLEAHLRDAQSREKTLKSQLDLIDGQTKVTILKIEETNLKIAKLKFEDFK